MQTLPLVGALVAKKYRIESLLGEGGMGAVFRARHEVMDKPVALKWLKPEMANSPEARHRFNLEARAAARIRHPNVVHVYDVGTHEGAPFMVMELLEGESLAAVLERGSVPVATVTHYLLGAMRGVSAAHACGITHRDIKPENIFVVPSRSGGPAIPKILDFGISKLHDDQLASPHITQAGLAIGTPVYMSMEQLSGRHDLDHRADIYSFGVLLYQVFTGRLPFDGENVMEVVTKIATERPPIPSSVRPGLSAAVDRIVMKAMAYRREDRFQSLDELIQEVSFCLTDDSLCGATASSPIRARLTSRVPGRARPSIVDRLRVQSKTLGAPITCALAVMSLLIWATWDGPASTPMVASPAESVVQITQPAVAEAEADRASTTTGLVVPQPSQTAIVSGPTLLAPASERPSSAPFAARDAGVRTLVSPSVPRAAPVAPRPGGPARSLTGSVASLAELTPTDELDETTAPSASEPSADSVGRRSGELRREDL